MSDEIGVGAQDSQEPRASLKEEGFVDWSALTSISFAGSQMVIILVIAVAVIAGSGDTRPCHPHTDVCAA